MTDYHIDIFWSDEDGAYIANLPDFEYCSAHGATPEDALRELLVAKEAWLDVARQHGDAIPEPRYRPLIYQGAG
jgi:predicted RNase H-like HicB family nuclease